MPKSPRLLPLLLSVTAATAAEPLATLVVGQAGATPAYTVSGSVEALRHGVLAAQIAGRISALEVQAGASVRAGEVLARIDAATAEAAARASAAELSGAEAQLGAARGDYERAQKLYAQQYLSAAAMEKATARWQAAQAAAQARQAELRAADSQRAWYTITAPFSGRVAATLASEGDLAVPGRPLLELYDPVQLRVSVRIPASLAATLAPAGQVPVRIGTDTALSAAGYTLLPAVDPATRSMEVRVMLPAGTSALPGQPAELQLPLRAGAATALAIPASAVIHRSELDAVYVVDANGRAHLRQLRLGPQVAEQATVLAGLAAGERIALDPLAAARQ